MLRVRLLGNLTLEGDGVVVAASEFPGRQGRLAFAYLVLNRRAVPRDELADVVWGEMLPKSWERDLSAVVSKLRSLLTRVGVDGAMAVQGAMGCYQLRLPDDAFVDVDAAHGFLEDADSAVRAGDDDRAYVAADVATNLALRPLLPGEDAEWIDRCRDRLQMTLVHALDTSVQVVLARGDLREALRLAALAVEASPYRESGYVNLMRVQLAGGDRAEALRTYERCRVRLAEDLGVEPSAETEAEYRAALQPQGASPADGGGSAPVRLAVSIPSTRYAKSGNLHIAYQVAGDGPIDVVVVFGFATHLDLNWETPPFSAICRRVPTFARLITFDKRGVGLSDRTERIPTLEEHMDDVRAVMDAAGSERAAVIGLSVGGPMSLLFAATYPERVGRLVLWGSAARWGTAPGYEFGHEPSLVGPWLRMFDHWGNGRLFRASIAQDAPTDEATDRLFARYERNAATPTMARAVSQFATGLDVRQVLPTISAPTLVLHRTGDPFTRVDFGRYLGEHIPGARYIEFPGDFHLSGAGADDVVLDEIERFLTNDADEGSTW